MQLQTGAVLRRVDVPPQYFAEGMTLFQGKIFQLTWQSQVGFIYDPATFAKIGEFSYTGEGWGLTHDAQHLIMSDGTNRIRFLDPVTLQVVHSINVFDHLGNPLTNINELEYINGEIYANIWQTDWIARINPNTGAITAWINLTGLRTSGDVLNGIAYDGATRPTAGDGQAVAVVVPDQRGRRRWLAADHHAAAGRDAVGNDAGLRVDRRAPGSRRYWLYVGSTLGGAICTTRIAARA